MKALAFDPGPTKSAFAAIEQLRSGFRLVDMGEVPSEGATILAVLRRHADAHILAIEKAEHAFLPKDRRNMIGAARGIAHHLMATTRVEGAIEAMAAQAGFEVVLIPATVWRRAVCGRSNPDDAMVKRAVSTWVRDLPARTNCHERDAVGCAIASIWRMGAKVREEVARGKLVG